jgi:hypothetical protein
MDLLTRLSTSGLGLRGKTPSSFVKNPKKNHEFGGPGLLASQLDINGVQPGMYDRVPKYQVGLRTSLLDLDGKDQPKYLDNPPQ